ncbi:DUF2690 domain-containing protein [Streptomyces cinerochromogenes]|uniref:DUF2690 domain-containing protein n=1 Tax=Streptomyces cinerochromogenes TaxID=66422 RepID=UPI0016714235|nr:DUF2690 domain-containing protein [Streptomyces cinerochromogenes]GGS94611.1 hypothetical protein GCM10010206_66590 [Streptomyces cinerochromogenes]
MFSNLAYASRSGPRGSAGFFSGSRPDTVARRTLEIRLSPSCQAGWIRAWPTHPGVRIEIAGPNAHPRSAVATAQPKDNVVTTTMIAAPHPRNLRACYYPSFGHPGKECFDGAS